MMRVEITSISTYNVGQFLALYEGQLYCFQVECMEDWDKLYDHLNKSMRIDASQIGPAHFLVSKIY